MNVNTKRDWNLAVYILGKDQPIPINPIGLHTLHDLKLEVQKHTDIKPDDQKLVQNGKVLKEQEDTPIRDLKLSTDKISLLLKKRQEMRDFKKSQIQHEASMLKKQPENLISFDKVLKKPQNFNKLLNSFSRSIVASLMSRIDLNLWRRKQMKILGKKRALRHLLREVREYDIQSKQGLLTKDKELYENWMQQKEAKERKKNINYEEEQEEIAEKVETQKERRARRLEVRKRTEKYYPELCRNTNNKITNIRFLKMQEQIVCKMLVNFPLDEEEEIYEPAQTYDKKIFAQLRTMGYHELKCKQALHRACNNYYEALGFLSSGQDPKAQDILNQDEDCDAVFLYQWFLCLEHKCLRFRISMEPRQFDIYLNSLKFRIPELYQMINRNKKYMDHIMALKHFIPKPRPPLQPLPVKEEDKKIKVEDKKAEKGEKVEKGEKDEKDKEIEDKKTGPEKEEKAQ